MEEFYLKLKLQTDSNSEKRVNELLKKQKEMDDALESSIEEFRKEILDDYERKMDESSKEGLNHCILYTYNVDELIGDYHKKNFLLRGPVYDIGNGNGTSYFDRKGVKCLMDRLKETLSPFRITMKFNRKKQTNTLIVHW